MPADHGGVSTLPRAASGARHPEVLQDVSLRLERTIGDPVVVSAKVLDVEPSADGDVLVVGCPPGMDRREHHFEARLSWTYPFGRMECTVATRPARREYGDVWLVVPDGPATRVQQREFFRASVSVPVRVSWSEAHPDEPDGEVQEQGFTGAVVDLSEGGLLTTAVGSAPSVGTAVEVTLLLAEGQIAARATVVREVAFTGGGAGVALAFADPAEHGDRLRRVAFEAERRGRRTS
jgi:hypothetical protein